MSPSLPHALLASNQPRARFPEALIPEALIPVLGTLVLSLGVLNGCADLGDAAADYGVEMPSITGDERDPIIARQLLGADLRIADGRSTGIYIPLTRDQAMAKSEFATINAAGGPPAVVFLNGAGGTYTGGFNDSATNSSSIVPGNSVDIDAFGGGANTWNTMMDCVRDQFSRFNITVTDVEPTSGDYIEAVVGGFPEQLGLPSGVGGVAPIDSYQCSVIDRAVVWVFAQALPNNSQLLCEVAAQEIAHAMSLDHELLCEDPMTYLSGCGAKTFQDVDAACGESTTRDCTCGRPSQNSVQILLNKFGAAGDYEPLPPPEPDFEAPIVALQSPTAGDAVPANATIQVVASATDNQGLNAVELLWDYSGDSFSCPGQGGGWTCSRSGNQHIWQINVGTGSRTFHVQATDVAGNSSQTEEVTINLGAAITQPDPTQPDPTQPDPTQPDPTQPGVDVNAPEVALISPANGALLPAFTPVVVVATATDDQELQGVGLQWDFAGLTVGCPYQGQNATCVVNGSTYTWTLNVGEGDRTFSLVAQDASGNASQSAPRTITLTSDPIPPAPLDDSFEDNDTWDTAAALFCGQTIEAMSRAGDDDWFLFSAQAGQSITIDVAAANAGADLDAIAATGPSNADIMATDDTGQDHATLTFVATSVPVAVRVRAQGDGGNYTLSIRCQDEGQPSNGDPATPAPTTGDPNSPEQPGAGDTTIAPSLSESMAGPTGGCSQTTTDSAWLAGLLLIGLLPRRRRH